MKKIPKTVFLLESKSDYEKIKKQKDDNFQIITFNFELHNIFKKKSIQHIISDEFLSQNELLSIQNNALSLSDWYIENEIKEYISYKGVNLGSLIQGEFINTLVNFLKRFLECSNIIKKYNSDTIFFSSGIIFEIMKQFSVNVKKISNVHDEKLFFPLDSLKIKTSIGIKNYSTEINISQNIFKKLKKITEKTSSMVSKRSDKNVKTILISEFNTLIYESLFLKMPEFKLNFVFFNRRQPTIWNLKSLSVIKKSKVIIENETTLMNKKIKGDIQNGKKVVEKNIDNLFKNNLFFKSFFSINGNSFWAPFSSYFINYFKKRSSENIKEIELVIELLEKFSFVATLIHSEAGPNEKIILQLSKKKKIVNFLLQHGLINDSLEGYEHNAHRGVIPIESEQSIVWGKINQDYFKHIGVSADRVHTLGTPIYDDLNIEKIDNKEDYVLLATSGPTKEDVFDLTINTIEKNIETIKTICKVVTKYNKKLIIKLHPSPDEFDPTQIVKEINPEIKIVKTGKISQLIKNSSIVVVIDESSAIIDAHLLGKPVLSVAVKAEEYGIPTVLKNNSCIMTNRESFDKDFFRVMNDKVHRETIIENEKKSTQNYISFQKNGAKMILSFLEKFECK